MSRPKFIFDLDGTLYRYKGGPTFATSEFYAEIKRNIFRFLEQEIQIPTQHVMETYDCLKQTWDGHVSLGVEKEYGVDRRRYFASTWDVSPEKYIEPNDDARAVLSVLQGRCAVLTEAPRVWAESALRFLNVYEFVKDALFTGEPDIRKPSVGAFEMVGTTLGVPFDSIFSVGDQEESDIILAHRAGMRAIRVGGKNTEADFSVSNVREILTLAAFDTRRTH